MFTPAQLEHRFHLAIQAARAWRRIELEARQSCRCFIEEQAHIHLEHCLDEARGYREQLGRALLNRRAA